MAVGGAVGALLRWACSAPPGSGFPWATLAINAAGSLLLALLLTLTAVRTRPALLAGLGPGVLGGFTTLSAYAEETRVLVAAGHVMSAGVYVVATLGTCLLAVALVARFRPGAAS